MKGKTAMKKTMINKTNKANLVSITTVCFGYDCLFAGLEYPDNTQLNNSRHSLNPGVGV